MTGKYIITTITNHTPIEGADKIVRVDKFGETLIVDKESNPIGTRGIVIDCLSVIDSDLCHHLNMYRHANLNKDTTKAGYIEDNGRVRAIKLRGVKCSGLFLSFKQLDQHPKLNLDTLEKLKDGTQDNEITDVPICKQFYRKVKSGNLGGKQGKSRENLVPTFKEHFDTDQLARNLDKVKNGDFCVITEKCHGCLPWSQNVPLWSGGYRKMSKIKKGDVVIGYDRENDKFIPSKVVNKFNNGENLKNWLVIKRSNNNGTKGQRPKLTCTEDHEVFTNGKFIKAKDVKVGDKIISKRYGYNLNEIQKQVLIGKNLGDGFVGRNKKVWTFGMSQKDLSYLEYCMDVFGDMCGVVGELLSGYGTKMYRCQLKCDRVFNELFDDWYISGEKQIPEGIELTPITLAFLYMDDGNLHHHKKQKDRAGFAICNFNEQSKKNLDESLKMMGFSNYTFSYSGHMGGKKKHLRLRFNKNDADKLFQMISPYICESMRYKLPEKYRSMDDFVGIPKFETKRTHTVIEEVVESIDKCENVKSSRFDIETETNNYIAGGLLVHNSSLRCGRLPVIKKPKLDKLLNKIGIKTKQKTKYDFVVGSRRVTKSVGNEAHGDKEHFYDADVWSYVAHKHFEDKLQKGETVYAEIVGYLPDGGLIMPSSGNKKLKPFLEKDEYKEFIKKYGDDTVFTYGCEPKQHKVFVYRITMTNEDGHSIDYNWDAVKARCEEMNIPTVPELARVHLVNPHPELRSVFNYQDKIQKLATELAEGSSTQFPTHLREGVCVRIDRGTTPIIMKEKAYNFKVLEGIIKESQDTIEDEA